LRHQLTLEDKKIFQTIHPCPDELMNTTASFKPDEEYETNIAPKQVFHLGGNMSKHLAPNGKPSNLTHEQWHLVRTPEFKKFFGDWENTPEFASKVIDENGEPLVLYHGSINKFNKFRTKSQYIKYKDVNGKTQKFFWSTNGALGDGAYFTPDKDFAMQYTGGGYGEQGDGVLYEVFLNLKNPSSGKLMENSDYDGAIGVGAESDIYLAKYPSQIKLADGTNTNFDFKNPDIRFEDGGSIEKTNSDIYENNLLQIRVIGGANTYYRKVNKEWKFLSPEEVIKPSVRISFSHFNTKKDIDLLVEALKTT
jgi:hypothetical protein